MQKYEKNEVIQNYYKIFGIDSKNLIIILESNPKNLIIGMLLYLFNTPKNLLFFESVKMRKLRKICVFYIVQKV